MTVRNCALMAALALLGLNPAAAQEGAGARQETPLPAELGPPPIMISLADAVQMGLKNNLDIKVARYNPRIREQDIYFQEAQFDPNLGIGAEHDDISQATLNRTDISNSKGEIYTIGFFDRLHWGASYSANLDLQNSSSTSIFAPFPTTYFASLNLAYNQSFLRGFGNQANETQIVIARNNNQIGDIQFRQQVLDVLQRVEDAYWELVFMRQDLDVKKQSLGLAQELLKLNKIRVQVGTLPPIEITQAEAEVASREQGVIVAENFVSDAEDLLRKVLNMPKDEDAWVRPIAPTDQPTFIERPVELAKELGEAIASRPDLQQSRLSIKNAVASLALRKNQLKWDLSGRATYSLQGLSGDVEQQIGDVTIPTSCNDGGADGIPGTGDLGDGDGICQPFEPPGLVTVPDVPLQPNSALQNQDYFDAIDQLRDREFASWTVGVFLNIPIGNNAAEATYISARLAKEQEDIRYEGLRLNAEVAVRTAARAIVTGKKRIAAAAKNVELQRKKVEAEQKKFENGMSTSFQVLTFQEDLTTGLGQQNRAMVDYRKSLTALELAKGTLDRYLNVKVQE
jgi:outer membrane protein TolC